MQQRIPVIVIVLCLYLFAGAGEVSGSETMALHATSGGHILGFTSKDVVVATASHALRVEFVGAAGVEPVADGPARVHESKAPPLTRVTYPGLWEGITLAYDAPPCGLLRSTYTLVPGSDPSKIRLRYNSSLSVESDGALKIAYDTGVMHESAPIAWQNINGQRLSVPVTFRAESDKEIGFQLGPYDKAHPLMIDPTLTWTTFLGGVGGDYGSGIAIDADGNVYVTGSSPATWGNPINAFEGSRAAFLAKIDTDGALVWNTFLANADLSGIAVDANGNIYVTGGSGPWGNPLRAYEGSGDAFAAKLTSSGALVWNTFLGGGATDDGSGIAVDGNGNVYITGTSQPTMLYSSATWGNPIRVYAGGSDAFVAKLDSDGVLAWNSFLGGIGCGAVDNDRGSGIAVDVNGNVYATGYSECAWGDPISPWTADIHAFVAKLNTNGDLLWSTFLGGSGIAVDAGGNVYVTGASSGTWGSPIRPWTKGSDAFAAKLNTNGALVWNTFLGGAASDGGVGIAVGADGKVYVTGTSYAKWGTPVRAFVQGYDAFAAKLDVNGSLVWNSFLGGTLSDSGNGIAVDNSGTVYVTGVSAAPWGNPIRAHAGYGDNDVFVSVISNLLSMDIALSKAAVREKQAAGTTVGTLSTTDPDTGAHTYTYTLVDGDGSADNGLFSISGNSLRTRAPLDIKVKSTCSIRVRSTEQGGQYVEKIFTVRVLLIIDDNGGSWSVMRRGYPTEAVWGSSSSDVFAVGDYGSILHYNGTTWSPMASGTEEHLSGIWGSAANDVFAVGDYGTILHYNGTAWSLMDSADAGGDRTGIWGSAANDVFAVNENGTILHYDGTAWSLMYTGTDEQFWGIWGSAPNDVFAVGNKGFFGGLIMHYNGIAWSQMAYGGSDLDWIGGTSANDVYANGGSEIRHYNGSSWALMDYNELFDNEVLLGGGVWGSAANEIFAVGEQGTILHYNGTSWASMISGTTANFHSIWGSAANDVFAVAGDGTIMHYNGTAWSLMVRGTAVDLAGVWGSSSEDIFAVGYQTFITPESSSIFHYNGTAWVPMISDTVERLYGIWGSSPNDVFTVGFNGAILHYNGMVWSPMDSGTTLTLSDIWGNAANDVFAVGEQGLILHYNGTVWLPMDSGTTSSLLGIWGSAANDVFAVGGNGTILHYNGTAWETMASGVTGWLGGVWGSAANDIFAVGADFAILHYNRTAWSLLNSDLYLNYIGIIWGSAADNVFISDGRSIYHYNGTVWSWADTSPAGGVSGIWGSAANNVFAVGGNGTIYHYDATLPTVTITANDATATEAGLTAGQYTVTRIGETSAALTVDFAVSGTATPGSDYISFGTSVTIPDGETSATITVTPINDPDAESPETVVATLSANAAYTIGTPSSAMVTITSDDLPPRVQFSRATSSGPESMTPAVINATLSAPSSQTVTVRYATANGTAVAGSDYTATSDTLTFNPGETSQAINVPITGDTTIEPNETFTVTLTLPVNATLGAIPRHSYTITNDDSRGSIRLNSATYTVDEAGPAATITATRTCGSSGVVGVRYATANGTATAGRDYTSATGALSWADGDMADKTFTVSITDDALDEPNRTFIVRLSAPTGGATLALPSNGTVTIMDNDDPPEVQFSLAAFSGAESLTTAVINVELSAASGRTVAVRYATANGTALSGSDYAARSGILMFIPGVTNRTIMVPIVNNTTVETPSEESFTVTLSDPVPTPMNATFGTQTVHTYTIDDEDLHGAIKLSAAAYSVGEAGTVTIMAMRTGGGSGAVSVKYTTSDGTATAGSDYLPASGTLYWAAGSMVNQTFTVPILPDTLDEFNETFTVTLSDPSDGAILGSPAAGYVTITDNDPVPTVRFSLPASSSGLESITSAVINVSLSMPSEKTVTVRYATVNGTAIRGSDYLATSGILTFTPGQQSGTITVPIIDDAVVELNQTFSVTLTTPVNAAFGTPSRHVYTITNDDLAGPDQPGSDTR